MMPPTRGNDKPVNLSPDFDIEHDSSVKDSLAFVHAALKDHPHDEGTATMAVTVYLKLVKSPEHAELVLAYNAAANVYEIMHNHGTKETLMESCLRFLFELRELKTEELVGATISPTVSTAVIVSTLTTFGSNLMIQRFGTLILCWDITDEDHGSCYCGSRWHR